MPGLTLPSEETPPPSASPSTGPSTPAQQRRTSASATPQQHPQPPVTSSPLSRDADSPIRPSSSSSPPAHLRPTFTGSGTYYTPNFAADRPRFTHIQAQSQPDDANTIVPGAPAPIDLESNPDAIALQSTIAILQIQRMRAADDMVKLKKAKDAALADTEGFVRDLEAGVVGAPAVRGKRKRASGQAKKGGGDQDAMEDDSSDEDSSDEDEDSADDGGADAKAWQAIPKPQNVARMPPINWSRYAVVGDSLDKLHAEQRARPSAGAPAVYTPGGTYEENPASGVSGPGSSPATEYTGPLAPFDPLVDRVDDGNTGTAVATPKR